MFLLNECGVEVFLKKTTNKKKSDKEENLVFESIQILFPAKKI